MISANFSLPSIATSASVGRTVFLEKQGKSGYTASLGQERSDLVSIAFAGKGKGIKREPEEDPVEDSDGSVEENLYAIPEPPLSRVRNLVRDILTNFGNEKTVFPKGNSANARGKQRPEVQNAISEASEVLNRLPSIELDTETRELRRIAEEVAPGKPSKNWFSRGVGGLNLGKNGAKRDEYHGDVRARRILSNQLQQTGSAMDNLAEEVISQNPSKASTYRNINRSHRHTLAKIYDKYRTLGYQGNGVGNPQVAQQEAKDYENAEIERQAKVQKKVLSSVETGSESNTQSRNNQPPANDPSQERGFQGYDDQGRTVFAIFRPDGSFAGYSHHPQLRGG